MEKNKFAAARIFSDNMVLQREKANLIWGTGIDGKLVEIKFKGNIYTTFVSEGKWRIRLAAMNASKGDTMLISCEEKRLEIKNVSVGEVWLAGGQSNMEFYLRFDKEFKSVKRDGENEDIFFFDYPEVAYPGQIEEHDYSNFGFWRPCKKEHLEYYSAVAYYFAEKLQKEYKVPVGIVGCNWGGTSASCWMDESYLKDNEGKIWLEEYKTGIKTIDLEKYDEEYAANPSNYTGKPFENKLSLMLLYGIPRWLTKLIASKVSDKMDSIMPAIGPKHPWRPCGVYESMLKQVAPYGIRGVIWYQGESDDIHADIYDMVLTQMIQCWRDLWKENIPFLITQIAPMGFWLSGHPENYYIIREKQEIVSKNVDNVWLTTAGDAGMEWDVHPKRKRPIGERLALLAQGHIYGEKILCDPPECTDIVVESGKVILKFINVDGGIYQKGKGIASLECTGNGKKLDNCRAYVDGEKIVILHENITPDDCIQVSFARTLYHEVNIFNKSQIPVRPFYIENTK